MTLARAALVLSTVLPTAGCHWWDSSNQTSVLSQQVIYPTMVVNNDVPPGCKLKAATDRQVVRVLVSLAAINSQTASPCLLCVTIAPKAAGEDDDGSGTGFTPIPTTGIVGAVQLKPEEWPTPYDINLNKSQSAAPTQPNFTQATLVEVVLMDKTLKFITPRNKAPDDPTDAIRVDDSVAKSQMLDCLSKTLSSDHYVNKNIPGILNRVTVHANSAATGKAAPMVGGFNIGVLVPLGGKYVPIYIDPHLQNNG